MTTPDHPSPDEPREPEAEAAQVDPRDALRGLEDRPRIDEQGYPTAYTAVPPPLQDREARPGPGPELGQWQSAQPGGPGRSEEWQPPSGQPPQYGQAPSYGEPGQEGRPGGQQGQQGQQPYGQQPGYGAYPPPPPGYSEPYGGPLRGERPPGMPPYATWGQRAGAWLVDNVVAVIGIWFTDASYYAWGSGGPRVGGWIVAVVGAIWAIYNAYLGGRTGQSTGKRLVGIRLARYVDGRVVGPALGLLRLFMNVVFWVICAIPGILNYLWPLWDRKSQTWSDKIASSVVVQAR